MTDIGKRLLDNLPPKINRNGEIISALIANKNGNGAIEKMFQYGDTVKKRYAQANNVYNMDGELLDQTMNVFSHFERFYNESDSSFAKRNKSIFVRGGDVTFGTTWNVKHVFEYYFPNAKIFLIDNIGRWEENILINSDFESTVAEEIAKWTISGCELNKKGAFSGGKGVYFTTDNGVISQSAAVEKDKFYFVTCVVDGKAEISVTGASGDVKELHTIGESIDEKIPSGRTANTENWRFVQFFFKADKNENVTVIVKGETGSKVDLVTLDKKKNFPCFMIYVWFNSVTYGGNILHLSKTGNDPIPGIDYKKESYFDNTFFSGIVGKSFANDIYRDILSMVKAAGTKADIMLITKETD